MNCGAFCEQIPLYLYGELAAEDEEQFERHLDGCLACRAELEGTRAIGRALDARVLAPEARLLAECRQGLMTAVEQSGAPVIRWSLFRSWGSSALGPVSGLRKLAFAAALVGLGFIAARFPLRTRPSLRVPAGPGEASVSEAGIFPSAETFSNVRSVQPDPVSGRIRIGLDETRRRFISGSLDDTNIQQLLLTAAGDELNPGLRVESIDILKDHSRFVGVRRVLLEAFARDPNPGVRLKALDGLKGFAADTEIRQALARALLADNNPGVRVEVIEVLTEHPDDSLVGVCQSLVRKENNSYVRRRCQEALRHLNASEGTF